MLGTKFGWALLIAGAAFLIMTLAVPMSALQIGPLTFSAEYQRSVISIMILAGISLSLSKS